MVISAERKIFSKVLKEQATSDRTYLKKQVIKGTEMRRQQGSHGKGTEKTSKKADWQEMYIIGLSNCKVTEKILVQRCYECTEQWHEAAVSKKYTLVKNCFNCGRKQHLVNDCDKMPYCVICQKESHRSNQTRCLAFSKLIGDEKSRRENKRGRGNIKIMREVTLRKR